MAILKTKYLETIGDYVEAFAESNEPLVINLPREINGVKVLTIRNPRNRTQEEENILNIIWDYPVEYLECENPVLVVE